MRFPWGLFPLIFVVGACAGKPDYTSTCASLAGTYTGTFTGNLGSGGNLSGTLTLVAQSNPSQPSVEVTGNWNTPSYFGKINALRVTCPSGQFSDDLALSLTGPMSVLCVPPATQCTDTRCYCSGATLGTFAGSLSSSGGSGTWNASSGAAMSLKATGSGTWSVTK